MKIYKSITELIGKTPLFEVSNIEQDKQLKARVLIKLEYFNPAGSVKDRAALSMIEEAERQGKIQPGALIIEPTSGNTGIGLAAVAASRGYRTVFVMPETMSVERRKLLAGYGAQIVLTEGSRGMAGAIAKAEELEKELEALKTEGRIDIAEKLKVARSYGDLSENAEYDAAKEEQAIVEARIADLEATLKVARIIDDDDLSAGTVSIGMRVRILAEGDDEDEAEEYDITGSTEADMDMNRISDESPVGAALVGHKAGDEVEVTLPNGNIIDYKILSVARSK